MTTSEIEAPSSDQLFKSTDEDDDDDTKSGDCSPSSLMKCNQGGDTKNEVVRLNVGGTRYEVARDTLMRYEGSMLATLVSGNWKEGDGEKEIFIDRDGRRFGHVLDYLRSNRICLPHLADKSMLMEEFGYFGIDADTSKVSVKDDFVSINALSKEIKEHEAIIEQKRKKIAAMKESYRLVGEFSNRAESRGLCLRHYIQKDVDKELLRGCLLSRGLYVVAYTASESGDPIVTICPNGMEDKVAPVSTK